MFPFDYNKALFLLVIGFFLFVFETGSYCVAQLAEINDTQAPECWDYKHALPSPLSIYLSIIIFLSISVYLSSSIYLSMYYKADYSLLFSSQIDAFFLFFLLFIFMQCWK
jgi:hypothetical protein